MSSGRRHAGRVFLFFLGVALTGSLPASGLKPDEELLLYPALALPRGGAWEIQVHGLVYEPERRRLLSAGLRRLIGLEEEDMTVEEKAIYRERSSYFLVDNERGKKLSLRVAGMEFKFGTSAANGHFSSVWRWPTNEPAFGSLLGQATNGLLVLNGTVVRAAGRPARLEVHLLGEEGWSVVSDIDDTIKISQVRNRGALLRNTFARPFQPVAGMAEVYRAWEQAAQARFHYVTASPWQLYQPLAAFVSSNGFPGGTFHMKDFRLKDRSVLELFSGPEAYKRRTIDPLLRSFPLRKFVLVGDSGEKDPEIYGRLARAHPAQVRRILIHDVTGDSVEGARYQAAFRGVPRENWQLFRQPGELARSLPER